MRFTRQFRLSVYARNNIRIMLEISFHFWHNDRLWRRWWRWLRPLPCWMPYAGTHAHVRFTLHRDGVHGWCHSPLSNAVQWWRCHDTTDRQCSCSTPVTVTVSIGAHGTCSMSRVTFAKSVICNFYVYFSKVIIFYYPLSLVFSGRALKLKRKRMCMLHAGYRPPAHSHCEYAINALASHIVRHLFRFECADVRNVAVRCGAVRCRDLNERNNNK